MVKKKYGNLIGAWAFLIGVILAAVIGLFTKFVGAETYTTISMILVVLGIIVGLLNVANKESSGFLLAGVVLVLVSFMGQSVLSIIPQVRLILGALLTLFVPATIIVALKSVFEISKS